VAGLLTEPPRLFLDDYQGIPGEVIKTGSTRPDEMNQGYGTTKIKEGDADETGEDRIKGAGFFIFADGGADRLLVND
jgi:hypothetical protein